MKRNIFILLLVLICTMINVHAKANTLYVLTSKQLPYYMIVSEQKNKLHLYTMDKNHPYIHNKTIKTQLKRYNKNSKVVTIAINLKAIAKDYQIHYDKNTFQNTKSCKRFIKQIQNKTTLSHILHYQKYIKSNASYKSIKTLASALQKKPLIMHKQTLPKQIK